MDRENEDFTTQGEPDFAEDGQETGRPTDNGARKKGRLGRKIALVVVILVVVLVGSSATVYATQHDKPGFCNFICHQPMDSYVEGYNSENTALLVTAHRDGDVTCLQCHEATLSEQVNEVVRWTTGDFKDPLDERRFASEEFCLTEGCHVPFDTLKQLTENYQSSGRNPHESPHGQNACYDCHKVHETSRVYCTQCHSDVTVPESWR
jgi:hypothetical protein